MNAFVKKAILATALGASAITGTLATATPAMANTYGGRGGHGGGEGGAVVAGGLIGLALGAMIASSNRPYYPEPAYMPAVQPAYYQAPMLPAAYINPAWVWRDGFFWDGYGHRYYRDGRPFGYGGYYAGGYRGGYGGGYAGGYRGYAGGGHAGYAGGGHGGGHGGGGHHR